MLRQRLRNTASPLAFVARALVALLALGLLWTGAVILLLALNVAEGTVDSISGYRTAFDYFADLGGDDLDGATTRAIMAGAGLAAFLLFGYLALQALPRPYLARQDLELTRDSRGNVTIEPRAIERLAETAAEDQRGVAGASGRYGTDELAVGVAVRHARDVADTLGQVHTAVREALAKHGLPAMAVSVILTGYEPKTKRELN